MALFTGKRDVSLVRHLNRELLGDIITQQASFYKYKLEETEVNIYGEASGEKFYDGPFLFNCLIEREDEQFGFGDSGIGFAQNIKFSFLRDDLVEANVLPEVGDIIFYEQSYYGVESTVSNQYWGGKNPDYPNNVNPLNPGLEDFSSSISIVVSTYYIPSDKVSISPYKERF